MKNYYQILGLESNASKDEIKKAYRIYATKFHPDKQNGDKFFEERFKEILEAYEILSDDSKRTNYDSKRTSDYSKRTSSNNKQSYSKSDNDINREREQKEQKEKEEREKEEIEKKAKQIREERAKKQQEEYVRQENEKREKEEEKRIREENIKARRNTIYYTSKDLSVNGMYIYMDSKSYLIDNYDSVVLRKDDNSSFVFIGIIFIIIGILTIAFFIGTFLIIFGIFGLFHKEYFIVLVNEYGDTPLIKGNKPKMKRIANKINKAFETKKKYAT